MLKIALYFGLECKLSLGAERKKKCEKKIGTNKDLNKNT